MDDALALCVSDAGPLASGSTHCDVFLSFAGGSDAARDSFPSRLQAGLAAARVSVCRPDDSQAVVSSSRLPHAVVRQSQICIPIFSEDYASSERCLRQLVQMMEGKRSGRQMVWPIFNRVEPWHVRNLKEGFGKARRSDIEGVQTALEEVGFFNGWTVTDENEEEKLKMVIQNVLRGLRPGFQRVYQSASYNVFLNFRGFDTRQGFAYYLYTKLRGAGVSVFKDDTSLPIGEDFRSQLVNAISRSTIYITVFSPNYISSKWCLHEFEKILECEESMGHIIFPIFYRLDCQKEQTLKNELLAALLKLGKHPGGGNATKEAKEPLSSLFRWGFNDDEDHDDDGLITNLVQHTLGQLWHHFRLDVPQHLLRLWDVKDPEFVSREVNYARTQHKRILERIRCKF